MRGERKKVRWRETEGINSLMMISAWKVAGNGDQAMIKERWTQLVYKKGLCEGWQVVDCWKKD